MRGLERVLMRLLRMLGGCATAALLCGSLCQNEDPYLTNPNLVLLLRKEGHCLFNPIPSGDGKLLYYLDDTAYDGSEWPTTSLRGDLRVYNLADGSDRLLLSVQSHHLALSRDCSKLLTCDASLLPDTLLLLTVDTSGLSPETLRLTGDHRHLADLAFSTTEDRVVYNLIRGTPWRTCFYSRTPGNDTVARLVHEVPWQQRGFDMFDGDSIYADSVAHGTYPAVNPQNSRWAVFASVGGLMGNWLRIHDRHKGKVNALGSQTHPYRVGYVEWPCWTADGRDLVFSSAPYTGGEIASLELWLLRDALAGHR